MKLWLNNEKEAPEGYINVSNIKEAVDWVEKLEAEEKNEPIELHINPLFGRCSTLLNWLAIHYPNHRYKVVFLSSSNHSRHSRWVFQGLRALVKTLRWEYDDRNIWW